MKFPNPRLVVVRTQVLDYFQRQMAIVKPSHVLFQFEVTNEVGAAELRLVEQLCWQMGFEQISDLSRYITGENSEILDFYPEFPLYRDIVFMFKFMMTPTAEALPEVRPWHQSYARLDWKLDNRKYVVKGFNRTLKCTGGSRVSSSFVVSLGSPFPLGPGSEPVPHRVETECVDVWMDG